MNVKRTIEVMRETMRGERQDARSARSDYVRDYAAGRISAFRTAIYWLTESKTGCPDCHAPLPNDGSCCDACGWTKGVPA